MTQNFFFPPFLEPYSSAHLDSKYMSKQKLFYSLGNTIIPELYYLISHLIHLAASMRKLKKKKKQ